MKTAQPARFHTLAAWPVAGLLAAISLGGLLFDVYARETPAWRAQALGQDWFDLVVATPWLVMCGLCARSGDYRWRVLLAGTYAYVMYSLVIYAFAVHFNALFLAYCAALGLAAFAFIGLVGELRRQIPMVGRRGAHVGGGFLVAVGVLFALLWLVEDVPAIVRGVAPRSVVETGLLTNPVHALDLAFVLPAHVVVGVLFWRRRATGRLFAPIVLAFGIVMSVSIAAMMIAIELAGGAAALPVEIAMAVVAAATTTVLTRVFHDPVRV